MYFPVRNCKAGVATGEAPVKPQPAFRENTFEDLIARKLQETLAITTGSVGCIVLARVWFIQEEFGGNQVSFVNLSAVPVVLKV